MKCVIYTYLNAPIYVARLVRISYLNSVIHTYNLVSGSFFTITRHLITLQL